MLKLRSIVKVIIQIILSFIFYTPIILYFKIKKKHLNNNIIIVEPKYYDAQKKLIFNSEITKSIQEYIDETKTILTIKNFYPDDEVINKFYLNLFFLRFFYENKPKYIFFKSDYQDPKTTGLSLFLIITLKLFESKTTFISHSGDPNWFNNQVRGWVCKKVFDAHSFVTQVYIKKSRKIEPMPLHGVPKNRMHKPSFNRTGDIFYIGRLPKFDEREKILNFLKENRIDIKVFGESTGNFLTSDEFYKIYKNFKMTINFPKQEKLKGATSEYCFRERVLNALSHGVLLFDQKNPFMDILFKSDEHYVNYFDKEDLLEKIKYYQNNYETAAMKIINKAFYLIDEKYGSKKIWSNIFNKI